MDTDNGVMNAMGEGGRGEWRGAKVVEMGKFAIV